MGKARFYSLVNALSSMYNVGANTNQLIIYLFKFIKNINIHLFNIGGVALSKRYRFVFVIFAIICAVLLIIPVLNYENEMTDIIFFGVGKADSILIKNSRQTILIDTGHKKDKKILADKLRTLGIRKIDYMILSHPDKDHIGGASYIIENFTVDNLIQTNYEKGSKDEARLKKSLVNTEIKQVFLSEDYYFVLGDLEIDLLVPEEDEFKKSNDNSINALIKDRELNYFFGGDSEKKLLKDLIKKDIPVIDVYKVAHHGRKNSNSKEFINKIMPKYSVITNSVEEAEVSELLDDVDSKVFYAFDDDVHIHTDGKEVTVR